uniref:Peptidase S74 domain-containing protein n=1 Tax=Palpitomonas bilix TaxID=652834 RepID=A0A7S3GFU9_9EUKA
MPIEGVSFSAANASGDFDVSSDTLTLRTNQISGDKVEGGTISAITINTFTTGTRFVTADGSLLAGASLNELSGSGSVIIGGGSVISTYKNLVYDSFGFIGGGSGNVAGSSADGDPSIGAIYATVLGGGMNKAAGRSAAVAGGVQVQATGDYSTSLGGAVNLASGSYSVVLGGKVAKATGNYSSSMGATTTASGTHSSVIGGATSTSSGDYAVGMGRSARATLAGAFVFSDSSSTSYTSAAADSFSVLAKGGMSMDTSRVCFGHDANDVSGVDGAVVGGGGTAAAPNSVTDSYSVVAGGSGNTAGDGGAAKYSAAFSVVMGGESNSAGANRTVVAGGESNVASARLSAVGGGLSNTAGGVGAVVGGGESNTVSASAGAVLGGESSTASGILSVAAGLSSTASGTEAAASGHTSTASGIQSVAFGLNAVASGLASVAGGSATTASASGSTAIGGVSNTASGANSTSFGGDSSVVGGADAVVFGGELHSAAGEKSSAIGGKSGAVSGVSSSVIGGESSSISSDHSTVIGSFGTVSAAHSGVLMVGSDSTSISSSAANGVALFASGGMRLHSNTVVVGDKSTTATALEPMSPTASNTGGAKLSISAAAGSGSGDGGMIMLDAGAGATDGIIRIGSHVSSGVRIGAASDYSQGGNTFTTHLFGKLVVHGDFDVVSVQNLSTSSVTEEKFLSDEAMVYQEMARVPTVRGLETSDSMTNGSSNGSIVLDAAQSGSVQHVTIGSVNATALYFGILDTVNTTMHGPVSFGGDVDFGNLLSSPTDLTVNINDAGTQGNLTVNGKNVFVLNAANTTLNGDFVQTTTAEGVEGVTIDSVLKPMETIIDIITANAVSTLETSVKEGESNVVALGRGSGGFVNGSGTTVIGTEGVIITRNKATSVGGVGHALSGYRSTAVGGENAIVTETNSVAVGGSGAEVFAGRSAAIGVTNGGGAYGYKSIALGKGAKAFAGSFAFGPTPAAAADGSLTNAFVVSAAGGITLMSSGSGAGVSLASGSGSFSTLSSRSAKTDVKSVDEEEVSRQLHENVGVYEWKYKDEEEGILHMGPISEDFYSAFHLSNSNRTISTVDADGVKIAAIKVGALCQFLHISLRITLYCNVALCMHLPGAAHSGPPTLLSYTRTLSSSYSSNVWLDRYVEGDGRKKLDSCIAKSGSSTHQYAM